MLCSLDTSYLVFQQETGLCKSLLQDYAQKMNYAIPSYICNRQTSEVHLFICTVEIGGIEYIGSTARSKKEAEIKAVQTALLAIQGIFPVLFILKEVFFLFYPCYSLLKLYAFILRVLGLDIISSTCFIWCRPIRGLCKWYHKIYCCAWEKAR
jgi:hypothetical protein